MLWRTESSDGTWVLKAEAERRLKKAEIEAGEASFQAAFWRNKAISLGANENEYRKAIDEIRKRP